MRRLLSARLLIDRERLGSFLLNRLFLSGDWFPPRGMFAGPAHSACGVVEAPGGIDVEPSEQSHIEQRSRSPEHGFKVSTITSLPFGTGVWREE